MSCTRGKASPNAITERRLYAASAGFCQNPDCTQKELFVDTGYKFLTIAEMAHIFPASDSGPRANPALSEEERGHFDNLILLCSNCHTTVDKAPESYPDSLMRKWKRDHAAVLERTFFGTKYDTRSEARNAVMGLLSENKHIFDEYGPANEYRFNPESELAVVWSQKVVTRIIPNNRRLLTLLDKNRKILEEHEYSTVEALRQHLDDLERRHFKIGPATISTRFPIGLDNIFKD